MHHSVIVICFCTLNLETKAARDCNDERLSVVNVTFFLLIPWIVKHETSVVFYSILILTCKGNLRYCFYDCFLDKNNYDNYVIVKDNCLIDTTKKANNFLHVIKFYNLPNKLYPFKHRLLYE
ncbi:hypothetical protein GLOIN_2v667626 [Rhizophagus irregularis DAOM 181602=DAOM 197198]|uniref:Uncharacterized protein n=1 Tax=Rhizophagus irregularis (strain DAOM 181602 / DAOM 197198 / MUCL 43194) TaxID=747089 RepID=A0A2P4P925_RHIID|nr:hypothetical protein GLOIN_2v667626 [Rhizophagus irregularis DAOM 181602=DAOM 197198]POG61873.1 hypothetical protein GLOIN_2v667626 [Rhizophagus irregularis DAOM 181602=DAOM 197198]GET60191.1 hypothetical protein GLOIN_2v667626 [Rhizophagus irregularis DAOM 181602=DAOM 197198]|eukprot:XP_025168739.1 hypothetical protein GLOIN_2v667626 [Rhizophagus irregularis DAOM 181602=DAOM 197198]